MHCYAGRNGSYSYVRNSAGMKISEKRETCCPPVRIDRRRSTDPPAIVARALMAAHVAHFDRRSDDGRNSKCSFLEKLRDLGVQIDTCDRD